MAPCGVTGTSPKPDNSDALKHRSGAGTPLAATMMREQQNGCADPAAAQPLWRGSRRRAVVVLLVALVMAVAGTAGQRLLAAVAPAAPSNVAATAGDARVKLSWSHRLPSRVEGFRVYRDGRFLKRTGRVLSTSVAAVNGEHHGYAVAAYTYGGAVSAKSATVYAVALPPRPPAPKDLTTTAGDERIKLVWSPATRAAKYRIYRNGSRVATVGVSSSWWTDTGRTNGREPSLPRRGGGRLWPGVLTIE